MTAVSLINPYAPAPASSAIAESGLPATQAASPIKSSASTGDAGLASDQSGQGAGNGTGTGGAHLASLLKRGREDLKVQHPTPKSIVEAQSSNDPASEFLERQAKRQIEAKASEEARVADQAIARAEAAKAEAEASALPEYVMPNPLPTAPILQREPDQLA